MTAKRYSRIIEAARLYPAVDNWIKYMTDVTKRGSRVGKGEPRVASQVLYVTPFNVELAASQVAKQSGAKPTWDNYKSHLNIYTDDTAPTDAGNIVKLADYAAARVIITSGRSNQGTVKTSAVTGQKYLDYGGKSTSLPFGRSTATETTLEVYNSIVNSIQSANSSAGLRFALKQEKY